MQYFALFKITVDNLSEVFSHFSSFLTLCERVVLFPVEEVASLAVLAASFDEVGLALFGFVFEVAFFALSQFIDSVSKLAFIVVATIPSIEIISTQFVFEFFVFG